MKKTILFLEQQSWRGGGQRVLQDAINALAGEFHPVVAFPDKGDFRSDLSERGIETFQYPLGSYRPGKKSAWEMVAFAFRTAYSAVRLAAYILIHKIQIVYINGPRALPAGVLAAWLTRRPSLFHLHNILTRRAEVALASFFARFATTVVACSNAAAAVLLESNPNLKSKTHVLYNSVPRLPVDEPPPQRSPHSPFTIGMVGRITEGKGQRVLIEAVSKLPTELRNTCRVLLVGAPGNQSTEDDSYLSQIQEKAGALDLDRNISWTGYQADVGPLYEEMDVLAVPSIGTEGLPLVVLEAMQRGIPVIATDTGGTAEVVKDGINSLVVSPGDATGLAGALRRLMTDPSLLAKLGSGALGTIDARFSPEQFSQAIKGFASDLCPPVRLSQAIQDRAEVSK